MRDITATTTQVYEFVDDTQMYDLRAATPSALGRPSQAESEAPKKARGPGKRDVPVANYSGFDRHNIDDEMPQADMRRGSSGGSVVESTNTPIPDLVIDS